MHKFLIAAVAAVAAVSALAISAGANPGEAGTSWDFEVTPNKVNKSAKSHSLGRPAKEAGGGRYIAPTVQTFGFPRGSRVDTRALPYCKLTASEVGGGEECPGKTLLGDGSANVIVGQTATSAGTELVAEFTAYNQKNKILFLFQTCGAGTGPGTGSECEPAGPPNIVEGVWSGIKRAPKLRVETPDSLLDIGVIIIRFELFTDNHTRKVKGERVSYVRTPKKCKGKWKTYDKAEYVDGSSQTIRDAQKCKKP